MYALQISLLMEDKNLLSENHENAKKELQTVIQQLEGQLEDKKSHVDALKTEVDTLKADMSEKFVPKESLKKLEEQIAKAATGTKEEVMFLFDSFYVASLLSANLHILY